MCVTETFDSCPRYSFSVCVCVCRSSLCLNEVEKKCGDVSALKLPISTTKLNLNQLQQLFQVSPAHQLQLLLLVFNYS